MACGGAALILLLLAGCKAVGPDYQAPASDDLDGDASFR